MSESSTEQIDTVRHQLEGSSRLGWVHWLTIVLSLALTLTAWYYTKTQHEERVRDRFEREAAQSIYLIKERMELYESALWGGVGAIQTHHGQMSHVDWKKFAQTLRIDEKYPGINGIGVIKRIGVNEKAEFIGAQRRAGRPEYTIYPEHPRQDLLPIVYIEPIISNKSAVGLDIAHEKNRHDAALKARDTGLARITGPIVLVQDAEKTPGFLFYAPFYAPGLTEELAGVADRQKHFLGMVYAPFVVSKLMAGTLARDNRLVRLKISEGTQTLYNELVPKESGYDPTPMFNETRSLELYGRVWQFDIQSSTTFRQVSQSHQSLAILIGGLLIDTLLFTLFVLLSRANGRALSFADTVTDRLRKEKNQLERSNRDLELFAYTASHDLQEPLRMVGNFTRLLQRRYENQLDEKADTYIGFAVDGVTRMQDLLNDLLAYSRVGADEKNPVQVNLNQTVEDVIANIQQSIAESRGTIEVSHLPVLPGYNTQLLQLFQNLLSNAIKFRATDRNPVVKINVVEQETDWLFSVSDNGVGLEMNYAERIFVLFQRVHDRQLYSGTGLGLAICKKVVLRHGGKIWVDSIPDEGTTFWFTLAKDDGLVATDTTVDATPATLAEAA